MIKSIILIVNNSSNPKMEHRRSLYLSLSFSQCACVWQSEISLHHITINFVHVKYYTLAFNRLAFPLCFFSALQLFFTFLMLSVSKFSSFSELNSTYAFDLTTGQCDVSTTKNLLMFCSIYKILMQ